MLVTNACSINNKFDELCCHVNNLLPDIVIVTESWLDASTPSNLYALNDYSLYRSDRDNCGGGVAVWSRHCGSLVRFQGSDELKSNILPLWLPSKNTLFIAIYHPYWGKCKQHNLLSSILQSIIDLPQFVNHNVFVNNFRHELACFASGNSLQHIFHLLHTVVTLLTLFYYLRHFFPVIKMLKKYLLLVVLIIA